MKEKTLLCVVLMLISFNVFSIKNSAASGTVIQVNPAINTVQPGESFNVTIDIVDAHYIYVWGFKLSWDPAVLEVTSVLEGDFLDQGTYDTIFQPYYYNDLGYIMVVCVLQGEPRTASASGAGTLAIVTFSVEVEGGTTLHLYDTSVRDYDNIAAPHTAKGGYFAYPIAKLHVDPSSVVDEALVPGSTFDVNISVLDVADLYGWMFYLSWDPAVLEVTDVLEGGFLNQEGTQPTVFDVAYPEAGTVCVNCTLVDIPAVTASGNGTLATVVFSVEHYGTSLLDLLNATLLNSEFNEIPHSDESGSFSNTLFDIAVENIEASTYDVKVGDTTSITVVVRNKGSAIETFDVRIWANISLIETIPVTNLTSGDQKTLTFDWTIHNVEEGKYVIKAEAEILPGEPHTDDNTLIMGNVIQVTQEADQQFPTTLVTAVGVIIILLVAIILYYIKRKRSV